MDWRHKAVCRDEDPELFFPVGNSGPALAQIADAKLVCNRCPVTTECLTWALDSGQDAGVWGVPGEDQAERLGEKPPAVLIDGCDDFLQVLLRGGEVVVLDAQRVVTPLELSQLLQRIEVHAA